ncbi:albusnodin/ikarugamycin family macrolactam cyclase [Streptomyces sp. NPDC058171]
MAGPRFVAGVFTDRPGIVPGGPRPVAGHTILDRPGARAWAVGHTGAETPRPVRGPQGDAQLVTAGACFADAEERRAALGAACTDPLGPVTRLPGSYLALVWREGVLTVVGDRAGVVPVYWTRQEGAVWWATAGAPLAALIGTGPRLPLLLADLTLTGVDITQGDAHYDGVRRVPPGHALVLSAGAAPRTQNTTAVPALTSGEGPQRLRTALTTAVGRRSEGGTITADLSGGVDSTTITCLAARRGPVLAVTYTDAHLAEDDDLYYARRVAVDVDGITHQVIDARQEGVAQFDGLEDPDVLPFTDIPSLALGVLAIKRAQLAPMAAAGSTAHLTGRGGDNVLTAAHSHPADQFLAGHRRDALHAATEYARAHHVAPWQVWRQLIRTVGTSYPRALERLAATVGGAAPLMVRRSARWEDLAWCSLTAAAQWLTPAGRRAVAELVEARAQAADPAATPAALHDRLDLEFMAGSHAMYDAIARQELGVAVHAPFLDTAVVDACHSVPSFQRMKAGVYKPLARAGFAGLVPDFVLRRQTKTAFTTSLYSGLAANAATLRRILTESRLAQAGLLDGHRVGAALNAAVAGAPAPLAALHTLIVTELWLTTLPSQTGLATWWQPDTERSPV